MDVQERMKTRTKKLLEIVIDKESVTVKIQNEISNLIGSYGVLATQVILFVIIKNAIYLAGGTCF